MSSRPKDGTNYKEPLRTTEMTGGFNSQRFVPRGQENGQAKNLMEY